MYTTDTMEMIKNEAISENDLIQLRERFVNLYCSSQNWDRENLSYEQVFEIRSHKEWISPGLLKS